MWVEPVTLEGRVVRLEPLTLDHVDNLWQAAEPEQFLYTVMWEKNSTLEEFRANAERVLALPNFLTFVTVLRETGQAIGSTSYLEITPPHRSLSIGATWIARPYQGTQVNPEAKYLMLRHAFEKLGAVRLQLKCDSRNEHSARAIAKLGAVREGTLRKAMVLPDGYIRDTVVFSILDSEWPAVKKGLEERLGYVP